MKNWVKIENGYHPRSATSRFLIPALNWFWEAISDKTKFLFTKASSLRLLASLCNLFARDKSPATSGGLILSKCYWGLFIIWSLTYFLTYFQGRQASQYNQRPNEFGHFFKTNFIFVYLLISRAETVLETLFLYKPIRFILITNLSNNAENHTELCS